MKVLFYPPAVDFNFGNQNFGSNCLQSVVVVTTFNQPLILEHVLCSLDKQTIHAAQIVVADDGSSPGCRDIVHRWSNNLPVTLVRQPNDNFRASRIRNLAVLKAKGNHLIFHRWGLLGS